VRPGPQRSPKQRAGRGWPNGRECPSWALPHPQPAATVHDYNNQKQKSRKRHKPGTPAAMSGRNSPARHDFAVEEAGRGRRCGRAGISPRWFHSVPLAKLRARPGAFSVRLTAA
jgi:hypothetical protein